MPGEMRWRCPIKGIDLPANETIKQGNCKRVFPVPVFIYQPRRSERCQHLIDVARAERLLQELLAFGRHFLNREFRMGMIETGNDNKQIALPVGGLGPSASKKVGVQLSRD